MVKPHWMLIAEDHSDQASVTEPTEGGGLGFDATWYSAFYHHLIGDGDYESEYARLLFVAGLGDDRPLAMDYFAGALGWSGHRKVVYQEGHDDAGNAHNTARTMTTAVNHAPFSRWHSSIRRSPIPLRLWALSTFSRHPHVSHGRGNRIC
jgi:1,4-alpha-glucan branching enzyme